MSDLVKRLRGKWEWPPSETMEEAAAEIERLRAALDILQAAMTTKKPIPLPFKKAIVEARAALSGDTHD